MSVIVFKLGGSLLTCPDLSSRMRAVLRDRSADRAVIIVGGGASADVVRHWSRIHSLSEEEAHWIALRSLSVNRALVRHLLPETGEIDSLRQAERVWAEEGHPVLLKVEEYLRQTESGEEDELPHTWDVTTDSIAAWVAMKWSAQELVLLKSTPLVPDVDLKTAQRCELVDAHFLQIGQKVARVSWCHLLEDVPTIHAWLEFGRQVTTPATR